MTMTIYDYFNALTSIGLGEEHTEEFEDAINDTLAMIQQSTLGDIENNIEEEERDLSDEEIWNGEDLCEERGRPL